MGASGSQPAKPIPSVFGAEEEGKRGPCLGAALLPGPEGGWRLVLAAPLRLQVFDTDATKAAAVEDHAPYTACSVSDEEAGEAAAAAAAEAQPRYIAVGCQDGNVLVFSLARGTVSGPLHRLRATPLEVQQQQEELEDPQPDASGCGEAAADAAGEAAQPGGGSGGVASLAMSITVLQFAGREALFAGSEGRCLYWDLGSGELRREFRLPGAGPRAAIPGTLVVVRTDAAAGAEASMHLWVGMDSGSIAVFDAASGVLVRSFSCAGPETLVSLAHFPGDGVVFALSAHRRVSVWDAASYTCIQKYPAELMTCGADLSAMIAVSIDDPPISVLMLAGVDGSLCIRRVSRRADGKLNCVLLSFRERASGDAGAPVTCLSYHATTDSVLVGDAGCTVTVLGKLKDQLGATVPLPGDAPGAAAGRGAAAPAAAAAAAAAAAVAPPAAAETAPAAAAVAPADAETAPPPRPAVPPAAEAAVTAPGPAAEAAVTAGPAPQPPQAGAPLEQI